MNNSKQAVLSIVGIAILVIAVVGVSFAFFTYSRQGTTNNFITTGSISLAYQDEAQQIKLTNQFPKEQGYVPGGAVAGQDGKTYTDLEPFTFNVVGTIPNTAQTVYYKVTAVEGEQVDDKTKFTSPSQISIKVGVNTNNSVGTATIQNGYDAGHELPSSMTNGTVIATGNVAANGIAHSHNYTLKMWVNDSVTISDTDTATYRASADAVKNTSAPIYSDLYYSLKVNVEARDSGAYNSPNFE